MPIEIPRAVLVREPATHGRRPLAVLTAAPRSVPLRLALKLLFAKSPLAYLWWLLAALGMAAMYGTLPKVGFGLRNYDRTATATITSTVDISNADENPHYRVDFVFVDDDGHEYSGSSYTKTRDVRGTRTVKYSSRDPSLSCLDGMSVKPFSVTEFALVLSALVLGLAGVQHELRGGLRALRLLRYGQPTTGTLVGKRPTCPPDGDEVQEMEMSFEYEVNGTPYSVKIRTMDPGSLEDDACEAMLYDPASPARATTLDHLPGAPNITPDGAIACQPGIAVHVLILPTAATVYMVLTIARLISA